LRLIQWIAILFSIALVLHPSRNIPQTIKWDINYQLKSIYQPGEVVEFKSDYPLAVARLDGKTLTPIFGLRSYWGTAGFQRRDQFTIYGEFFDRKPNWLMSHLFHTTEYFFTLHGKIDRLPIDQASKLQLSRKTWSKMDDKFAQEKRAQSRKIRTAMKQSQGNFTNYCFKKPLNSFIVSDFASPRTLPNGKSYYHTGLDMRARTPTPLPAAARGRVLLAEKMIVPGNIVILDHGGGIVSRYLHLSQIDVKPGDYLEQGDIIGLTGGTGRVEAPHLHFEIVWKGRGMDPLNFIEFSKARCSNNGTVRNLNP
tara:strand:+ start:32372 stop:33301 length:930 start_codon:yes stop_codon:yes gene_type:complete